MAIVRWEPARELGSLQQEVNRVFSTFFDTAPGSPGRWSPAVDLVEHDDAFVLVADLPGVSEDDVEIEVDGGTLVIRGMRAQKSDIREGGYIRAERSIGEFRRELTLPDGVDPEQITATFDRGVLEVRVPKPEQVKPRRVAIKVGRDAATIEGRATGGEPRDEDGAESPDRESGGLA